MALRPSIILGSAVVGITLAAGAVVVTNPTEIGPVGVTIWFVCLLVAISNTIAILLYWARAKRQAVDSRAEQLQASVRQGGIVGGFVTVILALSSLRQLSSRDVVLLMVMAVLGEVFLRSRV